MRSILSLLIATVFALSACQSMGVGGSGGQAPVLSRIVKSGELRIGMSGDQPPLNARSKSGSLIGLEVDLAKALAEAMKVQAKFVVKPFPDLLPALEKGDVDMVMSGVTITPGRNMKAAFVGPYFLSGKSILTSQKALDRLDEVPDINASSVSLAALRGSTSQQFVEMLAPNAKLVLIDAYDEGVSKVIDGSVDALVADYPACVLSVLRNPEAGLATLENPFTVEPIGIALPPNAPLFVNLVENYLSAIEGTGILAQLTIKWLDDPSWISQLK